MIAVEKHKAKRKLARSLMTEDEVRRGTSMWRSKGWEKQKKIKAERVRALQQAAEMKRDKK